MHECVSLHCFKWVTGMYENEINLLRFSDQERAVKGETGEACAAPNHNKWGAGRTHWQAGEWSGGQASGARLGMCMSREQETSQPEPIPPCSTHDKSSTYWCGVHG